MHLVPALIAPTLNIAPQHTFVNRIQHLLAFSDKKTPNNKKQTTAGRKVQL